MTQLLENAVLGTALILAAALLRRGLGGRLIPEARLALWAVCLIRLLAPAFPASGLSLWGLLPRTGAAPEPAPLPGGAAGNLPAVTAQAAGTTAPGPAETAFPWGTALLCVWIGVGVLLAARYALSWNRTRRLVAQAILLPRDDPRYAPLPKCARLREGVMDGAPLTFGAARPTVVLPPGLSGEALDCVLAHEGVHVRRRDNLWHYAMGLALAVYWWNPAVWLMAGLLRRDIELACDRAAVKKLGAERRARYAETLVALATAGPGPAFCQAFGRRAAEERIISVMKYKKTTAVGAALTLALVLAVTVGFASGPKEDSAASTVEYHGRAYNRADLSAETLEWLDWYLALPEEGRLAVSYEPWELHSEEFPGTVDAGADQPAAAEEELPAFEPDYDPQAEDSFPDAPANALAVCPVEGCAVRGSHTHDGVAYLCSGAHCGGVCDGSCHNAGDGGGAVPSESKIPGFVPDYDPSTQDSAGAGGEPVSQPASSGHHSDSHHGNGYQGGRH